MPLIILARTDANAAKLITNDHDDNDKPFLTGERSPEGFYYVKAGIDQAISRGLAYAPYSDLIWCETATPNLEEAKKLSTGIGSRNEQLLSDLNEKLTRYGNYKSDKIIDYEMSKARYLQAIARSPRLTIGMTLPLIEELLGKPHDIIISNNLNQQEQLWIYFLKV